MKRSQGRVQGGLLSNEKPVVPSAEVVQLAEGNTDSTELVRFWPGFEVSMNPARTHVQSMTCEVSVTPGGCAGRQSEGGIQNPMSTMEKSASPIQRAGQQRPDQVGWSPPGARVTGATTEGAGNSSLGGMC